MRRIVGIYLILYSGILLFLGVPASAVSEPGILVSVYDNYGFNQSPPLPTETGRPMVGQAVQGLIQNNFDQTPLFGMSEDFIVKYEGHITAPISGDIVFLPSADDGTKLYIDGVLLDNNWVDKGGGGNLSQPVNFTAGVSLPITLWFYENGGGAFVELYWDIGNGFEIVPESAFTQSAVVTTTVPETTTTQPPLPREARVTAATDFIFQIESTQQFTARTTAVQGYSSDPHLWLYNENNQLVAANDDYYGLQSYIAVSLQPGNYRLRAGICCGNPDAWPQSSNYLYDISFSTGFSEQNYSATTTTTTTSSTSTTTTTTTTTTSTSTSTTTTTVPQTTTTHQETTTIAPVAQTTIATTTSTTTTSTVPLRPETTTTIRQTSTTARPTTTTTTTTQPPITTTTATTLASSTTTLPMQNEPQEALSQLTKEDVSAMSSNDIQNAVQDIIEEKIDEETALALVTNAAIISSVTEEQASEIFNAVDVGELSTEQAEGLIDAVQEAPEGIRKSFEQEIDIFGSGKFDTYVPVGSKINVHQRRALIAASAGAMLAAPAVSSAGQPSGSNKSRGPQGRR